MTRARVALLAFAVVVAVAPAAPAVAEVTCVYDPDSRVVRIRVPGGSTADIGRNPGGVITEAGAPCTDGMAVARVTNVDRIVVRPGGGEGFRDVIIEQHNGRFAPGATLEAASSEIEFDIELGTDGFDHVRILGRAVHDHVVVGTDVDGAHWINLNGDEPDGVDADVRLRRVDSVEIHGREGSDVLSANGGRGTGGPHQQYVDIFGSDGADWLDGGGVGDRLTGESGRDTMKGRRGPDIFDADDDAVDVVRGGRGTDSCTCDTFDDIAGVP